MVGQPRIFRGFALAIVTIALWVTPSVALADPADNVIADCSDNGAIDTTHTGAAIDTALARMLNDDKVEPYDCSPELWRLLDLSLGDAMAPTRDCIANGRIDGGYAIDDLQEAQAVMPQVIEELSGCPAVLHRAEQEARESISSSSASISRSAAKRYAAKKGRKIARRDVSVRLLNRRRASRWYSQVRWPAAQRGVCYAEVIIKRSGSKVASGSVGRWCSTATP